jgi:hypothetical protein
MSYLKCLSAEPLKEVQAVLRSNDIAKENLLRERPPEPWHSFFLDIDQVLVQPVELQCIGGFANRHVVRLTIQSKVYYLPPNKKRMEESGGTEPTLYIADGASEWWAATAANEYRSLPQGRNLWAEASSLTA